MGEKILKIYFKSHCWNISFICITKKCRLYKRAQGFNDLISTSFYEFAGKNNEALVPINAFLTFSPTKSCLGDLTTLRQRTELLQVKSVKGGLSLLLLLMKCIQLIMFRNSDSLQLSLDIYDWTKSMHKEVALGIHFINISKHLRGFERFSSNRVSTVVWKFKASPKIQPVPSVVWFVWFWFLFDLLINFCV